MHTPSRSFDLGRTLVVVGLTFLLGACGFALRGAGGTSLPESWKSMYLASNNPNSELSRELRNGFAAHGVLWQERDTANYTLNLGAEKFSQRNLSLNAQARASELELTLSTKYSVNDASNLAVIEPGLVTVVKQMENDPRNVVGKAEEIRLLKAEMRTELAQQMMRRIAYFAASTP